MQNIAPLSENDTTALQNKKVIAITLYRRPVYTREMFESLVRCVGVSDYSVLINCDFDFRHADACNEVYRIAQEYSSVFAHFEIQQNCPKLGIDVTKLDLMPRAYEKSDFVILLEDDTIPSADFLQFMEFAAEYSRKRAEIVSITGYNRLENEKQFRDVFIRPYRLGFRNGFCPWGWGMWRDRYDAFFGGGASAYKRFAGGEVNGLYDHYIHTTMTDAQKTLRPELARIHSIGGEDAEHTPSKEWHDANERNDLWAGAVPSLPLPPSWVFSWIDTPYCANPGG